GMRILAKSHSKSKCQIVAEECGPIFQVTRANERRGRWIRHSLIAASKLNNYALGQIAWQRILTDKRRPCHWIPGLPEPAACVFHGLYGNCARNVVGDRRQILQWAVVVEKKGRTCIK